jgi:hypothetical protein
MIVRYFPLNKRPALRSRLVKVFFADLFLKYEKNG